MPRCFFLGNLFATKSVFKNIISTYWKIIPYVNRNDFDAKIKPEGTE